MNGFVVDIDGKKLPLVRVSESLPNKFIFQIITKETVLSLNEKDAKRLYQQLYTAFRPIKRSSGWAKHP